MSCLSIAKACPIVLTSFGAGGRLTGRPGMLTGRPAAARAATGRLGATGGDTHNSPQGNVPCSGKVCVSAPTPFFLEAGAGPGVVCLHSNASTSGQWRALMALLAPRFHVLAPDSLGAGKSPAWPADRSVQLRDEVALIEPVLQRAGDGPVLVAHSYGASVALVAAALFPGRFRALALYEPTLFSLLDAESPPPNEADGIRGAVAAAGAALDAGDADAAAGHFIDFWMGEGAWQRTPEARRGPIAESVRNVRGWANALVGESTPLSTFAALDVPVLLMVGADSPASSRGVARLLAAALPRLETVAFGGVGHMGPITHAFLVNETIARFLDTLPPWKEPSP